MSFSQPSIAASPPHEQPAWMAWLEWFLVGMLVFTFAWSALIPAWSTLNTDFPNYYLAAKLFREGYPFERVYDWIWFQRQKDHAGIDQPIVGTVLLTPPSLVVLSPWTSLAPLPAKRRWLLANVAFLLAAILLLKLITSLKWRQAVLLAFLAIAPLRNNFLFGQMHVLVLLLLALAAYLYFRDYPFLAGIALAMAAVLKIYPALFVIFFILKKQWRAALGLVAGLAGVAAWCVSTFGVSVCRFYLLQLPWALRGETVDPYNVGWNSIAALLRRLFIAEPELNPAPVVHAPWVYSLLYPAIQIAVWVVFAWALTSKTGDRARVKLEWATFLSLLLLLSPQPVSYHFIVLIVPIVLVADYLVQRSDYKLVYALVAIYALVCSPWLRGVWTSPSGWKNLLCFPRLFLMLLFCGIMLVMLISSSSESFGRRLRSRNAVFAGLAFLVLASAGAIASAQHFKGQFDNYVARVTTTPDSLMATEPAVSQSAVLFAGFVPQGFATNKLEAARLTTFRSGGDWFHPTVASGESRSAWAEVATQGESRVVRFSDNDSSRYETGMIVEAENAEEPVVSADGNWLAFLRETKGHGSLWLQQLSDKGSHTRRAEARQIAASDYDVRQAAFFPDHRIIFSSSRNGQSSLYVVDPDSNRIEALNIAGCSAAYPAVSPDGQWLAFSSEQRGMWQISLMNLSSRQVSELTHAECNSVSPEWSTDSKTIVYATDCGRGLGLTALARLSVGR